MKLGTILKQKQGDRVWLQAQVDQENAKEDGWKYGVGTVTL